MNNPLISKKLIDARVYERAAARQISADQRPGFHLTPMTGWCNDPNGFCYYNGLYHMFYQYHPYTSKWGPMHWGHAVSRDLIVWEHLPCALAPDKPYDNKGCFSGSAVVLKDGNQLLMYTGVHEELQADGTYKDVQVQCIAAGNGLDYQKYAYNPVITSSMLPEGSSKFDFRDPKICITDDGSFRAYIAGSDENGDGRVYVFTSKDGYEWAFERILAGNKGRFGGIWECPDFFSNGKNDFLIISPCDMRSDSPEYHNGHGVVLLTGKDSAEGFKIEKDQSLDYGLDFYAPQTMLHKDGRRLLAAWMGNWETCSYQNSQSKYFGQMIIPRELEFNGGRMYQKPVREFLEHRKSSVQYKDFALSGEICLDGIEGRCFDMLVDFSGSYIKAGIKLACYNGWYTELSWMPQLKIFQIDRTFSGSNCDCVNIRQCLVDTCKSEDSVSLQIIMDKNCIEVFINGGSHVMSLCIDTPLKGQGIKFFAQGQACMNVTKYNLC